MIEKTWREVESELDKVKELVSKKDQDFVLVIEGHERIGKSTLAIKTAKYLDPNFSVDNIVFTPRQFMKTIKSAKNYQVILYDEAGIGLYKRDSSTKNTKIINKIFMTIGQRNLIVILCIPSFNDLDTYVRNHRVNALFRIIKRGKVRAYSKRKIRKIKKDRLNRIHFPLCSFGFEYTELKGKLWEKYQQLKHKQLDHFLDNIDKDILEKNKPKVHTKKELIKKDIIENPKITNGELMKKHNVGSRHIYSIRSEMKLKKNV